MALVEYELQGRPGGVADQRVVDAYLFRDGVCIGLHLRKSGFAPEDERLFDATLRSVHFKEVPPIDEGAVTRP